MVDSFHLIHIIVGSTFGISIGIIGVGDPNISSFFMIFSIIGLIGFLIWEILQNQVMKAYFWEISGRETTRNFILDLILSFICYEPTFWLILFCF